MGWNLGRKLRTIHKMRDAKKLVRKLDIENVEEIIEAISGIEASSIAGLLEAAALLMPELGIGLEETAKAAALELLDEAYSTAREYIEGL
jgi:hypothetical protein